MPMMDGEKEEEGEAEGALIEAYKPELMLSDQLPNN